MQKLIILGTGGNAFDILDIVDALNAQAPAWEVAGFLENGRPPGSEFLQFRVLGGLADAPRFDDCRFINAIGSDTSFQQRREIIRGTGLLDARFATLVHPRASLSPHARLGHGVYVSFGASVGGMVTAGNHVSFCPNCTVGHDTTIGDCAIIAPGAIVSGFVRIEPSVYVGAGAMIRQRARIGEGALVGIGAVVLRDVEPGTTVVGNPARPLVRKS